MKRALAVCFVLAGAIYGAWVGFGVQLIADYGIYYRPAMDALLAGHVGGFFAHAPVNGVGGALLLQAPAALIGKLAVGTVLAELRFQALFSLLVLGGVGLYVSARMRAAGRPELWSAAVLALFVLAPVLLNAIDFGHPEEPLGAALCITAVLLAARDRPGPAGVVLGLALISKPWGVFAVAPALLAAPGGRERIRIALGTAAIAAGWAAVSYLLGPAAFRAQLDTVSGPVAHPVDVWWPFAHLHRVPGVTPAYFPPPLIGKHALELAVALAIPASAPLVLRARRGSRVPLSDCLALLSLLFLLRCMLDPSNHVYYQVPLVASLVAWEGVSGRPPIVAAAALAGFFLVFHTVSSTGSLTAQFAAYLLLTLPLLALLLRYLLRGGIVPRRDRHHRGQRIPRIASARA